MPTEMTRFTSEIAFRLMPQAPIAPITPVTDIRTVRMTTEPVRQEPRMREVTTKTARRARVKTSRVVATIRASGAWSGQ